MGRIIAIANQKRHAFPRFRTYEYDLEIKSASLALIQKKDL